MQGPGATRLAEGVLELNADRSAEVAMHQDQLRAELQQAILSGVGRRFARETDPARPLDPAAEA